MRQLVILIILVFLSPAWAGDISGSVTLDTDQIKRRKENRNPARKRIMAKYRKSDNYKGRWDEGGLPSGEDEDERSHTVIYLTSELDGKKLKATPKKVDVRQQQRRFWEHVTVVPLGSSVVFRNEDAFFHFIDCQSDEKLNIGEQKPNSSQACKPAKLGPQELFCDIHHRMNAYVYVTPNDYFATPKAGKFTLRNVPAGKYRIKAWHPRAGSKTLQTVTVPASGQVDLKVEL